ncbi:MAG: hypothetical protein ACR2KG_12160 [Nocardioidaceae bacterium]
MTLSSRERRRRRLEDQLDRAERERDAAGAVVASAFGFSGQAKRPAAEAAVAYWSGVADRIRGELDEPDETR